MMIVAIGTFVIAFPEALSLKDKRQILRSMKDRVRAKFNASIAEVDNNDDWNNGTVGVSIVANDKVYLEQVDTLSGSTTRNRLRRCSLYYSR